MDELAYRLPGKQNVCSSFCHAPLKKVGFVPFYRKSNVCFEFEKLDILQVVLKTMYYRLLYYNILCLYRIDNIKIISFQYHLSQNI